jgi:DNA-binding XRE family transcriptional regulator
MATTQSEHVPRFDKDRLRALRDERGLSRARLAAMCPNVSHQAIQAYEDGRNKPDIDRALELATALGVTVHHLTR